MECLKLFIAIINLGEYIMDKFFEKRLSFYKNKEIKLKRKYNMLSNLRLAVFFLGVFLSIFFYYSGYSGLSIIIALVILAFILLVIKHRRVNKELNYMQNMVLLNQRCIDRLNSNWSIFDDTGSEFADKNHPFTSDLDIFGTKSLYQWFNTAGTFMGREKLAQTLSEPIKDIEMIKKRQNAIKELTDKFDFCQKLQCETLMNKEDASEPDKLLEYAEDKKRVIAGKNIYFIFIVLPILLIVSSILKLSGFNFSWYVPFGILSIQCLLIVAGSKSVSFALNAVGSFKERINVYNRIVKIIEDESFEDSFLNNIKSTSIGKLTASKALKKLNIIADFIDVRFSQFYIIFNIIFLWDFHCMYAMEKWKNRYGKNIRSWLDCIGVFEELISFAGIAKLNPEWCYPDFSTGRNLVVVAKNMGHPLINRDKRVCNDMRVNSNICIITGSNMSGKTTLLRTVGINLVLAYSGAPVCASSFSCSIMDIITSMRINDDLSEGISTFYAELKRIKMIIDKSRKHENMIFLIDEILKVQIQETGSEVQ